MKIKNSFIVSATTIFLICWVFFSIVINTAQGVGDAPISVNPYLRSTWIALIVVLAYSVIFFSICGLRVLIKKWRN
jgi:succinate dehydrogenase hydrophobic anchor subunit